ncbi:MAG: hypothetical protein MUF87_12110 [Anaerolineae bacterium]|nr:hypothetical protein [Anaerolineae bacterium]
MKVVSKVSLLTYLGYFMVAIGITFPLILNFSSQLIGHSTGDPYEMAHHIWWFKYALQTGEPLFYPTLLAYPEGLQGISMWANPLQFFPAWLFAFVMPVASAYNLTVLLTIALNGWAMCFVLSRWFNGWSWAAFLGGLIYMAFPTMQGHLFHGHAGLLVAWAAPLYVYALLRLIDATDDARRWMILSVVFFLLTPSGHTLQTLYVLMPLTGAILCLCLYRQNGRGVLRVITVGAIGGILLLIFLAPMLREAFTDTYADDTGYVRYSLDLLAPITPSFDHPVFRQWQYTHQVLGVNIAEGAAYLGIAAGILCLVAFWREPNARFFLAIALFAFILGLGPLLKILDQPVTTLIDGHATYITLPWAFLYDLPGFNLARTPGRFGFTIALAIAIAAGYGARVVLQRGRWGAILVIGLGAFTLWEYQLFWSMPTVPADVPEAIAELRDREDLRAVMDVPWGNLLAAKEGLYLQTWHQQALIAGQITRRTPVSPAKLTLLEETLDLALLNHEGVDLIILHKAYADPDDRARLGERLGEPYYEDERYALFEVPETPPTLTVIWQQAGPTEFYLFTPAPGWIDFSAAITAPLNGRGGTITLNDRSVYQVLGPQALILPLPVDYRGYHTVRFDPTPACPIAPSAALICPEVQLEGATFTPLSAGPLYAPVELGGGVKLSGAYLPQDAIRGVLSVRLWWTLNTPIAPETVRFIKVIDQNGVQIAGVDQALGALSGDWIERIDLDLGDQEGTFAVYAGWYSYPDLMRLPVFSEGQGAQDGLIFLGNVSVIR